MSKKDDKFVPFFFTLTLLLGIFFVIDSTFTSSPSISLDKERVVSSEVGFTSYSPRGIAGGAIVPASCEAGDCYSYEYEYQYQYQYEYQYQYQYEYQYQYQYQYEYQYQYQYEYQYQYQ